MQETTSLTPAANQQLIKQTEEEILLKKLRDFGELNLSNEEQEKLQQWERGFARCFRKSAEKTFHSKSEQLLSLSDAELSLTWDTIARRSRLRVRGEKAFTFLVPVVGWFVGGMFYDEWDFPEWRGANILKKIRRKRGAEYFPHKAVREALSRE